MACETWCSAMNIVVRCTGLNVPAPKASNPEILSEV